MREGTRLRSRRGRKTTLASGLTAGAIVLLALTSHARASVTGGDNPSPVATGLSTVPVTGSFTYTVGPTQAGVGDSSLAGFPTAGSTFGVLTSGDANLADDPNLKQSDGAELDIEDPSRGEAHDSITLKVDFTVPGGENCLLLDYKFLSDEFPESVGTRYNDAFIAELDSTNWTTSGQDTSAPLDFAAGYGTKISVSGVGPTAVSQANSAGTVYDAATDTITTKTPVTEGAHSLYLSVFDASDHIYDSAVFLDNLRFNGEPPSTCHSPDIFQGAVGAAALRKKLTATNKSVILPLACNLPPAAPDPCVGTADITSRKRTIAKGSYSVPPATTKKVKLKLTRKAHRVLRRRGSIRGKLNIHNSINGASSHAKVKIRQKG
jgi:hypothetical protein